jgi:hypothetical protein
MSTVATDVLGTHPAPGPDGGGARGRAGERVGGRS